MCQALCWELGSGTTVPNCEELPCKQELFTQVSGDGARGRRPEPFPPPSPGHLAAHFACPGSLHSRKKTPERLMCSPSLKSSVII